MYENMMPSKPIDGHRGFYPACNAEEWEAVPSLYKAMEWFPVEVYNRQVQPVQSLSEVVRTRKGLAQEETERVRRPTERIVFHRQLSLTTRNADSALPSGGA